MGIQLRQFRQILFWPLEIPRLSARDKPQDLDDAFEAAFVASKKWHRESDLLKRGEQTPDDQAYAELVYFHPFVRRFLYGEAEAVTKPPMRLYRRYDIKRAKVEILFRDFGVDPPMDRDEVIELAVERIHFYLFDGGVAILVVEVASLHPLHLTLVEELLDRFRRAYPPYWETDKGNPGHCPDRVEWLKPGERAAIASSDYEVSRRFEEFVKDHKSPTPARHWQYLLEPLIPWPKEPEQQGFNYRQLEDERMPFMAYLSLDDPRQLSRADFARLCFADDSGASARLPYSFEFLRNFEKTFCYDRYWDPRMRYDDDAAQADPGTNKMTTRYLSCGYGFVMLGKEENPGFFSDGENGALAHFRRHYFQMGLIAHFHRAALLLFSDALSQAVAKYDPKNRRAFHDEVGEILQGFLVFNHRYWFREVSNQMQARELFSLWTRHLETQALFDQVRQEAQDAKNFLDMEEQKKQASTGVALSNTAVRLSVVATFGLAAGLVSSFLAIPWGGLSRNRASWSIIANIPTFPGRIAT